MGRWELGRSLLPQFPKRPLPGSPPPPRPPRAAALTANPSAWSTPLVSPRDPPKAAVNVQGRSWPPPRPRAGAEPERTGEGGTRASIGTARPACACGVLGPNCAVSSEPKTRGDVLRPANPSPHSPGQALRPGPLARGERTPVGAEARSGEGPVGTFPRLPGSPLFLRPRPPFPASPRLRVSEPRPPCPAPSPASSPALWEPRRVRA